MKSFLVKFTVVLLSLAALLVIAIVGTRIYQAVQGPELEPWHTYVPTEMTVAQIDAGDWAGYLAAENTLFEKVSHEVVQKLPPKDQVPENRYFTGSVVYPPHLSNDWN